MKTRNYKKEYDQAFNSAINIFGNDQNLDKFIQETQRIEYKIYGIRVGKAIPVDIAKVIENILKKNFQYHSSTEVFLIKERNENNKKICDIFVKSTISDLDVNMAKFAIDCLLASIESKND